MNDIRPLCLTHPTGLYSRLYYAGYVDAWTILQSILRYKATTSATRFTPFHTYLNVTHTVPSNTGSTLSPRSNSDTHPYVEHVPAYGKQWYLDRYTAVYTRYPISHPHHHGPELRTGVLWGG